MAAEGEGTAREEVEKAVTTLFWILFVLSMFLPRLQQHQLEATRLRLMRQLERKRGSRLITLIHRQESLSWLGFAFSRFIDIEDSEHVLRAIRMTPADMPIDLVLHTPGGLVLAAEQIARALVRHPAKVTVFVPHYAMSGGTLIALAADEILMDPNAVLGPVDPQLGRYPAASILRAVERKPAADIDDETLILADMAQKAQRQMRSLVGEILRSRLDPEAAEVLADRLTRGEWTHDYPITCEELTDMGIPVCGQLPAELYALMGLYPQPAARRPSVQFVPLPYQRPGREV